MYLRNLALRNNRIEVVIVHRYVSGKDSHDYEDKTVNDDVTVDFDDDQNVAQRKKGMAGV